jgi:uncharacterized protein YkwD
MPLSRPFSGIVLLGLFLSLGVALRDALPVKAESLFTGCGGQTVEPTEPAMEARVVELTNAYRKEQGLPPLKYSAQLSNAARYHAVDMTQDAYFKHDTFDLVNGQLTLTCTWNERVRSFDDSLMLMAENIAYGYRTTDSVFEAWVASEGHRRNLLTTSNWEIGVGYDNTRWVQDFGWHSDVYPVIINGEAVETASPEVTLYIYGDWQEMRLRNDDGAWSEWQPFQREVSWQLNPTLGRRLVTVEMRSGTFSTVSQDEIELTEPPTIRPEPTTTPTFSPTAPTDCTTCLAAQFTLEGRPPAPNPQWVTELTVTLIPIAADGTQGTAITLTGNSSETGHFYLNHLAPGQYSILVKGLHTLQRRLDVTLTTGNNTADFGLLVEGDIQANNRVDTLDFSALAAVYEECAGASAYLAAADLDASGCIDSNDLALLDANFGRMGDDPALLAALVADQPGLTITNKAPGDRFAVTIAVNQQVTQAVNAAAIFLDFDPQLLRATWIAPHSQFDTELINRINGTSGQIDYVAGILKESIQPPFRLATVTFEVLQPISASQITLVTTGARQTELASSGGSLIKGNPGGVGAVLTLAEAAAEPGYQLLLPLVRR